MRYNHLTKSINVELVMKTIPFIGRASELTALRALQTKRTASLVIVQGRRRIGKSRLIQEFSKNQTAYCFTGLAPSEKPNAQIQRDEFARQLSENLGLPRMQVSDWGDLFTLLSRETKKDPIIILFDEISWMGSADPTFLSKLKNAWDLQFSQNPNLILILCGSVSSWIEKNIINSTAFLGRPSLYLRLDPLSLSECNAFWGEYQSRISAFEKLKILSVTGGIPRYLELIYPDLTAEENIKKLCFLKNSPLNNEFENIFSDIFGNKSETYREIISHLAQGSASQSELLAACHRSKAGTFSEYLKNLVLAGFITRDYTWHLKTGEVSKHSRYRLKDNYMRFYLRYLYPSKAKIQKNAFENRSVSTIPGWDTLLALQFENLVLNNQNEVIKILNIPNEEIIFYNPFFQKPTKLKPGCQIDLLIQTKFNNVYICEIKFSRNAIGPSILNEMKQKITALKLPRNFSYRPVLIQVNGVQDTVVESGFFSNIIDFGQLLTVSNAP
jgi:uncharacterized protein